MLEILWRGRPATVALALIFVVGCGDSGPDDNNNTNENLNNSNTDPVCGNALVEADEDCDGTNLDAETCVGLGFAGGNLTCTGDCSFYTADCSATADCGNHIQEVGEDCDATDLGGASCILLNFVGGTLGCAGDCSFDTSQCVGSGTCGNDIRETGESCDGTDIQGTCEGLGFAGGELVCRTNCTVDTSNCFDCSTATPYSGPLCGPTGQTCVLAVNEQLPNAAAVRANLPDIGVDGACSPQILFNSVPGGYLGHYAVRDGTNSWTETTTPFSQMRAAIAVATDATAYALVDDGANGVQLYTYTDMWSVGTPITGAYNAWSDTLLLLSDDTLRTLVVGTSVSNLTYGEFNNGWSTLPWAIGDVTSRPVIAKAPVGSVVQSAYWQSGGGNWSLVWTEDNVTTETVSIFGASVGPLAQNHDLAVGAADTANPNGRPHIALHRDGVPGGSIHWVTRDGATTWVEQTIAAADNATAQWCLTPPTTTNETCNQSYHELIPLGILASQTGDVRVVFVDRHASRSLLGDCTGGPGTCFWATSQDNSSAELVVGWWIGAGPAGSQRMPMGALWPSGGKLFLDGGGRAHIALYATVVGDTHPTVHYLRVDPMP